MNLISHDGISLEKLVVEIGCGDYLVINYQIPAENKEHGTRDLPEVIGSIMRDNERICRCRRYLLILSALTLNM